MNEKRHFTRILCDGNVRIRTGHLEREVELLDLSLRGALVQRTPGWNPTLGEEYQLAVTLETNDHPISMTAAVAHVEDDRVGFQCRTIDIDSIAELRRLVELNIADPAILERELQALG